MGFTVLKSLRQKHQKKLFFIPFIFTFLNALFGLFAVMQTLDEQYALAAYCIIMAALMDFLDGALARAFESTSCLGMELDSLCDAISFCFAPAILVYSWKLYGIGILGGLCVGAYLCAGLFRLAKFNANSMVCRPYFIGLPTTMAAFFIANLILCERWLISSRFDCILWPQSIMIILLVLALLELSSLYFPSGKSIKLRSFSLYFIGLPLILLAYLHLFKGYPGIFLSVTCYILGSIIYNFSLYFLWSADGRQR